MTVFRSPNIATEVNRSVTEKKVHILFRAAADGKWEEKKPHL